jgi:V/A-type H+-transporting ATPase subunit D
MAATAPTKGNLMAARRSRALAENGWELMDKKRNILLRELMARMERATALQEEIDTVFQGAYGALALAELDGPGCGASAAMVPEDTTVRLRWRSVMGVEIPTVTAQSQRAEDMPYGLAQSSSALDAAYESFTHVKALLAELAETEIAVYRLAFAIQKSQKRANALENIVIPGLDVNIQQMEQALAEKEREEFVRQKVIKARKQG